SCSARRSNSGSLLRRAISRSLRQASDRRRNSASSGDRTTALPAPTDLAVAAPGSLADFWSPFLSPGFFGSGLVSSSTGPTQLWPLAPPGFVRHCGGPFLDLLVLVSLLSELSSASAAATPKPTIRAAAIPHLPTLRMVPSLDPLRSVSPAAGRGR